MTRTWVRRASSFASGLVIIAVLVLVAGLIPRETPPQVSGPARIIDGDSLYVGRVEVRLKGIDAPEYNQTCRADGASWPCGRQARDVLRSLTKGRPVACDLRGIDRYGRALGECRTGGVDINETLVREGWAVAYGGYEVAEARAAAERKGMWRGDFDRPRDHRAGRGIYGWMVFFGWPW
ncbi:MAG: thermonuclease family protein [Rhodobiaceae bacterium]|nr:thermonuclease family protein [Rhodobiaceae bacterium]MCC0017319.1 thermonuclease family protein [Rhodobiaceae bacterium]MCC0041091.1 thermonuclease family protein [Rhodobiaceae bacterium]